jgi:hypothetical protein
MNGEEFDPEVKLLHVHAQQAWHNDVWILGNRAGLEALKAVIESALASGHGSTCTPNHAGCMIVTDGEGFEVFVVCDDTSWGDESWSRAAVPYTQEKAHEHSEKAVWPWDRWKEEA